MSVTIGIPKEIKNHEYRVSVTPAGVAALVELGHSVIVQSGAGEKVNFMDNDYIQAGAKISGDVKEVLTCPMVVKVKEPQASEIEYFYEGQILFTYLHLAPDPEQTIKLLEKKVIGIAYETITDIAGQLPLLIPMSEVAGRLSITAGALSLQMASCGNGKLLGGVPGVQPAKVVVLGGGVVGTEAAKMALGLGADVTIMDISLTRLRYLSDVLPNLKTLFASKTSITEQVINADLVIGAVLLPGDKAPKLISREMVSQMKHGSVLVDVAIDQGGCSETSHATTHSEPTYLVDGVVHYCVANMPGAVARTSTEALTNATLPYVINLANKGYQQAFEDDPGFAKGLNVINGEITNQSVAESVGLPYRAYLECVGRPQGRGHFNSAAG